MKLERIITLIFAVFVQCGDSIEAPRHFHLEVDPGFSDVQSQAIFDAAAQWQRASSGYVTFDGGSAFKDVISVRPASAQELTAEFGGGTIGENELAGTGAKIQLLITLDPETFHQTALHELGHALGLVHLPPGNIMCANTVCATLQVACGDLSELTHHTVTDGCFP